MCEKCRDYSKSIEMVLKYLKYIVIILILVFLFKIGFENVLKITDEQLKQSVGLYE